MNNTNKKDSLKPVLNTSRRRWKNTKDEVKGKESERFREVLYKLAYKQLGPGEWKRLAHHWAFTEEQIRAVEHQYTGNNLLYNLTHLRFDLFDLGPSSYKEHGFRIMLIWAHGLAADLNPMRELYESLTAIGKRNVAGNLF